jgi:glyoxylate reductase
MDYRMLVTANEFEPADVDLLRSTGADVRVEGPDLSQDALEKALAEKDAYLLGGLENVRAATLESAHDLKVVAFLGVGYHAFIDTEAATRMGIAVTNAPGSNARAVAEFTMGLVLDGIRHISAMNGETKMGLWPSYRSVNLGAQTLGIFGMGTIGRMVADIASQGFGMRIVYCSRSRKPKVEDNTGARFLPLPELLEECDILSLHASYGPETHGRFGHAELSRLRDHVVIVNTSEAELIDPYALRELIESGHRGSVVMDGYYIEPAPSPENDPHDLLKLPDSKFLVLPHTANYTKESFKLGLSMNLRSIKNVLERGEDENLVNPRFRQFAQWAPALAS